MENVGSSTVRWWKLMWRTSKFCKSFAYKIYCGTAQQIFPEHHCLCFPPTFTSSVLSTMLTEVCGFGAVLVHSVCDGETRLFALYSLLHFLLLFLLHRLLLPVMFTLSLTNTHRVGALPAAENQITLRKVCHIILACSCTSYVMHKVPKAVILQCLSLTLLMHFLFVTVSHLLLRFWPQQWECAGKTNLSGSEQKLLRHWVGNLSVTTPWGRGAQTNWGCVSKVWKYREVCAYTSQTFTQIK